MKYRLIWVTDVGFAGMDDHKTYTSVEAAQADATAELTWKRYGDEWVSNRDQYGDQYFVKPIRRG